MASNTPGPWTIIQLPSMAYGIDAKVGPLHVCPAIAHGLADATLIAAAPDLLDALQGLNEMIPMIAIKYEEHRVILQVAVDRARIALAKAEGRTR